MYAAYASNPDAVQFKSVAHHFSTRCSRPHGKPLSHSGSLSHMSTSGVSNACASPGPP
jgi:hypothetical protein